MRDKARNPERFSTQLSDLAGSITHVCAFTGHRPSKLPWKNNEDDARCVALKALLTEQIAVLVEAGVRDFCSGMAEGTDYEKETVM